MTWTNEPSPRAQEVADRDFAGLTPLRAVEPNGVYWHYESFGWSECPHWNTRLEIGSSWTSNDIL